MRVALTFLFVALTGVSLGNLAALERPYKILMLLPAGSKSHKNFFMSIADALAERGHRVVMLSGYPASSKNPNILEINHGLKEFDVENMNLFDFRNDPTGGFSILVDILPPMAKKLYNIPEVMELYHKRKTFDLIIVDQLMNEISGIFPDLPPLLDIERNQSLTLINSHFSMDAAVPLLPSQVAVGAVHCRPANPLPKELETWISGAGPEGVVYFSLGTVARGTSMPVVYRDMFVEAFKRLKQRVIWKYDVELDGISDNVLIQKWLPQQDILGHPNVKVFITHGGLLSTQESLYHATPVVALPIFADQPKNALTIQKQGVGVSLVWEELSVDLIIDSIQEVLNNPKYKRNAEQVRNLVRDQPDTPKERAVFWIEYVVRHQGAPRLESQAKKLTWVEFLMLDVLLVVHVVVYIAFCVLSWVVRALKGKLFPRNVKKKRD
ncbi:UDP-glycosyltransferase UGT5-like isoform X2 [Penaeus chinensis]|uniref:UDP-glycosyltransferase UGT5-like isoform X2 n=1 Tax=Penaeus chinensis TaxID=139456 RepID=UPI001FB72851|nr:UDP-glycosyltransferase UGT5-like isoform X2 [Penaeus chinensis]